MKNTLLALLLVLLAAITTQASTISVSSSCTSNCTFTGTTTVTNLTVSGAITPNPRSSTLVQDEFMGGVVATGSIGQLGWNPVSGTAAQIAGLAGHPGLYNSTTTAEGAGVKAAIELSSIIGQGMMIPADTFSSTYIVRPNNTVADYRIGWSDSFSFSQPTDGFYLEKLNADTNWFCVTRNTNVQTRVDTNTAFSATAWITVVIRRVNGTTLGCSINGGTEATSTTNIPTASLQPGVQVIAEEAAAKTFDFDYWSFSDTGLTR